MGKEYAGKERGKNDIIKAQFVVYAKHSIQRALRDEQQYWNHHQGQDIHGKMDDFSRMDDCLAFSTKTDFSYYVQFEHSCEKELALRLVRDDLIRGFEALNKEEIDCLVLLYDGGMTTLELARYLGITQRAVEYRLQRIYQKIRENSKRGEYHDEQRTAQENG